MNSICKITEIRIFVAVIFGILLTEILTSCTDIIDPSAANSLSAIIAVIGEYLYATIALVLVVLLWILRPAGIALAVLGVLELFDFVELSANSFLVICIGVLMLFASFAPIKQYEPIVAISKHFKMPKKVKFGENRNGYQEFIIQTIVGITMLIIEYSLFAK